MTERRCEVPTGVYGPDGTCGALIVEGRCRWTHATEYGCGDLLADHGAGGLGQTQIEPWDHVYDGWECTEGHPVAAEVVQG